MVLPILKDFLDHLNVRDSGADLEHEVVTERDDCGSVDDFFPESEHLKGLPEKIVCFSECFDGFHVACSRASRTPFTYTSLENSFALASQAFRMRFAFSGVRERTA